MTRLLIQEETLRAIRDSIQEAITLCCQRRQRLEAAMNQQTTVEDQILAAAAELDAKEQMEDDARVREPGPDECDRCYAKAELYHYESAAQNSQWDGASVCDKCNMILANREERDKLAFEARS